MEASLLSLVMFDLGNVVIEVNLNNAFQYWSARTHVSPDHFLEKSLEDETYFKFERGEISSEDFHHHFNQRMDVNLSYEDFSKGWNAIYGEVFPETGNVLKQLPDIVTVVALTNTNELHCEVWPNLFKETLKGFDNIFISSKIGLRKPEERVFFHVLDAYSVKPSEAIFFDDNLEFITAASKIGIHAVHVSKPKDVIFELEMLGFLQ